MIEVLCLDPERIDQANRIGTLERLVSAGVSLKFQVNPLE
jgi:hypothetical protein